MAIWDLLPSRKYSYQRLDTLTDATVDAASSFFSNRPQSTLRRLFKNRAFGCAFITAIILFVLGLFTLHSSTPTSHLDEIQSLPLDALPPAFQITRNPTGDSPRTVQADAFHQAIQDTYARTGDPKIGCSLDPWHSLRYAALKDSSKPHPSASKLKANGTTIFMAMNLYNNAPLFASLVEQLPETILFLGVQNVYLSIYENNSDDETGIMLVLREFFLLETWALPKLIAFFLVARALDAIGASYVIISKGKTEYIDKSVPHRIEALAILRNRVLGPLFDPSIAARMPGGAFDEVLFINDIFWCAADILEVLYQRRARGAYQSCGVDWDWSMRLVYDRWVLRAISGRYVVNAMGKRAGDRAAPFPFTSIPTDYVHFARVRVG